MPVASTMILRLCATRPFIQESGGCRASKSCPYLQCAQSLSCRLAPGWTYVRISLGRLTQASSGRPMAPAPGSRMGQSLRRLSGPHGRWMPAAFRPPASPLECSELPSPAHPGRNVAWATGSQEPGRRGGKRLPSTFWIPQAWHQIPACFSPPPPPNEPLAFLSKGCWALG